LRAGGHAVPHPGSRTGPSSGSGSDPGTGAPRSKFRRTLRPLVGPVSGSRRTYNLHYLWKRLCHEHVACGGGYIMNCCSQRTSCAPRGYCGRRISKGPMGPFGSNTVCSSAGPTENDGRIDLLVHQIQPPCTLVGQIQPACTFVDQQDTIFLGTRWKGWGDTISEEPKLCFLAIATCALLRIFSIMFSPSPSSRG
jgi:hypothetical protein